MHTTNSQNPPDTTEVTTAQPTGTTPGVPRPRPAARCLRHHVWLAACDDCRREHAHLLGGRTGASRAR